MNVSLTKYIFATVVVPESKGKVMHGGTGAVYVADDHEEQQKIAMYLSRISEGVIHDLENDVLIIVRH